MLKATVLTAIVTASFSWGNVASSHWVGPSFWYASLSTSIFGIFLSAQQMSLLSLIGDLPEGHQKPSAKVMERHLNQILGRQSRMPAVPRDGGEGDDVPGGDLTWVLNWRLLFAWQCPMMFIAYSTLFYLVGLSVVAGTPLISEEWGPNSYVSLWLLPLALWHGTYTNWVTCR